jgi:hypothetical protein
VPHLHDFKHSLRVTTDSPATLPLRVARPSLAVLLALLLGASPTRGADRPVEFNRDVRPILSQNCFACHGFDEKNRKGELRLDVADEAFKDREGHVAIKPGSLADSEVWSRIVSTDPAEVMPPPKSHKELTVAQKETLRLWIEQGAKYQRHWAFEPIGRPEVPTPANAAWSAQPLDRFLLARMEQTGLAPRPEANRETLIRRVAFTLTGLPPTVAEVDAFLSDKEPGAYERLVDRYLASPHYGEEMARHWLDAARYADTHGLHLDNEREMWGYRDWVVRAFDQNLHFDDFTVWQLAGDLLPQPSTDQLLATGFNRCNVTTSEGGSIAVEFQYRYAVERTSTMMQAWMGLTGGCAVCHNHKYDPISAKEFYSLYAFFNSAADPAMDGNIARTTPLVTLMTDEQTRTIDAARNAEQGTKAALETAARETTYVDPASLSPLPEARRVIQTLLDDAFPSGVNTRNTSRNPSVWTQSADVPSGVRALRQANSFFHEEFLIYPQLQPTLAAGDTIEVWVRPDLHEPPEAIALNFAADGQRRAWWGAGELPQRMSGGKINKHVGPMPTPGVWTKLVVRAADLELTADTPVSQIQIEEAGGIVDWDQLRIDGYRPPAASPRLSFTAWWKATTGKDLAEIPADLKAVQKDGPDKKPAEEVVAKLRGWYLAHVYQPDATSPSERRLLQARGDWEIAAAKKIAAEETLPVSMVFKDLDKPNDSFVMLRGQYDKPGEAVQPDVPAIFPPLGVKDRRPTRLDLARWLVSKEHPLTARVAVNRFWQQVFGAGLVRTSYDFGTQGDIPTHPELLDWLASEFREKNWDIKQLLKTMLVSATFRQDSAADASLRTQDPENRWLARGPRFRLDAEQIRDNALAVSGLLSRSRGGRGVNPYQPPNLWEPVGYNDSNTRYYLQDHGDKLYRRSLYTFLKRTAPPPYLTNFDGTNREQVCMVRERSNTPLQALQLMNDVQHFEAARALAERLLTTAGSDADRIVLAYRTILSRVPSPKETEVVSKALARQKDLFTARPDEARKAIRSGESKPSETLNPVDLASWTLIANLLMNLDETVNRN